MRKLAHTSVSIFKKRIKQMLGKENPVANDRRKLLKLIGVGAALNGSWLLAACGGSSSTSSSSASSTGSTTSGGSSTTTTTTTTSGTSGCTLIPSETQGPYPLLSVLSNTAMVRNVITEDKTGLPLTVILKLVNVNNSCAPITNASVYLWHCDKDGVYSGYSQPSINTVGQTFLRGIWPVDANGEVTFTTIYPGWYSGRITHIHFQVYLNGSTSVATVTSQIAFPQEITQAVYNSALYAAHGQNTSVTSFSQDNIFSDGTTYQMATLNGDTTNGYTATLTVGISV